MFNWFNLETKMLATSDLKRMASMIDPNATGIEMGPIEEIDINHLDYGYVKTCADLSELEALLGYLRYENST